MADSTGDELQDRWTMVPTLPAGAPECRDTTLIVTTYNRPAYVQRLLAYLRERHLTASLILVDASEAETQEINRGRLRSHFPEAKFVSLPSSTSLIDTYKTALHSVDTPFLAYCPDDDFIDPHFIAEGTQFLRANDDYVLCAGRFCIASRDEATTFFGIQSNASAEEEDPLERFVHLIENYWPTLRSVQRTEVAIDAATALDAYMHHSVLGEALHGSVYALYGKLKVLDVVSQVQVEHRSRNQANDPSPRRLFCHESFWRCLRVLLACVDARLGSRGITPDDDRADRVRGAVFRHLANNYWIWRDGALADILVQFPKLSEDRANEMYLWLAREIDQSLLPELTRAEPLGGSGSYENAFKVLHFVTMLQVGDNGRIWRQSHVEMDGMGCETWEHFRDRWLSARESSELLNAPVAAAITRALLTPEFLERYLEFRSTRITHIRRILGGELSDERVSTLIDSLTAIAILERIGRLGGHEFELARDVVAKLEQRGSAAYKNLEEVARWIVRHPKPTRVARPAGDASGTRPRSGTPPTVAASPIARTPPDRSFPPPAQPD